MSTFAIAVSMATPATATNTGTIWPFIQGPWSISTLAEANFQMMAMYSGTFATLSARAPSNDRNGTTTIRSRVAAANGNATLAIGATLTGQFTDTTNVDAVASGSLVNSQLLIGGNSGTLNLQCISYIFNNPSATQAAFFGAVNTTLGFIGGGSAIGYSFPMGALLSVGAEASGSWTIRNTGTLSLFRIYINANNYPATGTVLSFVNGAAGSQSMVIGATITGALQDTTNKDALVSGNKVDIRWVMSSGTIASTLSAFSAAFALSSTLAVMGGNGVGNITKTSTAFLSISGTGSNSAEGSTQAVIQASLTATNALVFILNNNLTSTSTFAFRKNAATAGFQMLVGATLTGLFEDTSTISALVAGDLINWRVITGDGGLNTTLQPSRYSLCFLQTAAAAATVQLEKLERHWLRGMGRGFERGVA